MRGLLRDRRGGHAQVANIELFFDLVYVFAITQIALFMRSHADAIGLVQAALLFAAVWWAWIYTAWGTNWANPDTVPVRLMLVAAMLASLIMAVVLPHAFDSRSAALVFAAAYCALQVGRSGFIVIAMLHDSPSGARNMARVTAWFGYALPLWLGGALAGPGAAQVAAWAAALAIEYTGPFALFRTPWLGRSSGADWDISGSHMAERASLFVLIALGEGIVVTGTAFAGAAGDRAAVLALLACFANSALLWWIYFDLGAERGARHIAQSDNVGRIARNAYTYLHMPIVGGVVATAVADAGLMAAPGAAATPALIGAGGLGMIAYLAALALFKRASSPRGNPPLSHLVGLALLAGVIAWWWLAGGSAIGFAAAGDGVLLIVAIWEWGSFHGGWIERIGRWRQAVTR